jgi:CBS domain-containing protein
MFGIVRVREIMSAPAVDVAGDATLRDVACLLSSHGVGAAVVCGATGPQGIVSEHDVMRAIADGLDLDDTLAQDVMADDLAFVTPEDSLDDVIAAMADHWVRHLPVLDEDQHLAGMVSVRDALLALKG